MAQKQICANPIKHKILISGKACLYESDEGEWVYVGNVLARIEKEIGKTSYSYFIRAVDIGDRENINRLLIDQELYIPFSVKKRKTFFVYFATTKCHVGLSFLDEEIAREFYAIIKDLNEFELEEVKRRKEEKRQNRLQLAQTICDFTMDVAHFSLEPKKNVMLAISDGKIDRKALRRGSSQISVDRGSKHMKNTMRSKSHNELAVKQAAKRPPKSIPDFEERNQIRKKPPPIMFHQTNNDEIDFNAPRRGPKAIKYKPENSEASKKISSKKPKEKLLEKEPIREREPRREKEPPREKEPVKDLRREKEPVKERNIRREKESSKEKEKERVIRKEKESKKERESVRDKETKPNKSSQAGKSMVSETKNPIKNSKNSKKKKIESESEEEEEKECKGAESSPESSKSSLSTERSSNSKLPHSEVTLPTTVPTGIPEPPSPPNKPSENLPPSSLNESARNDLLSSIRNLKKNNLKKIEPKEPATESTPSQAAKPITMTDQLSNALLKFKLNKEDEKQSESDDEFK